MKPDARCKEPRAIMKSIEEVENGSVTRVYIESSTYGQREEGLFVSVNSLSEDERRKILRHTKCRDNIVKTPDGKFIVVGGRYDGVIIH